MNLALAKESSYAVAWQKGGSELRNKKPQTFSGIAYRNSIL